MSPDRHGHPRAPASRADQTANQVRCTVCLKWVPQSAARSAEGTDYVWYFCGPDCFERWHPGFPKPPLVAATSTK